MLYLYTNVKFINMVRKILFGLIICSAFILNAQDFTLDTNGVAVSGTINVDVTEADFTGSYTGSLHLVVNNNSASDKMIIFERHNVSSDSITTHEICDNQSCMQSSTPTTDHVLYSPNGKLVTAGGTFFWDIHVRFGITAHGNSHEKYTVYEVGNETNSVELDVVYTVLSTGVNELANSLKITKPYPNPANDNVSFNYNLSSNGYITIHDLTGKQIANVELVQGMQKATFNTSNINSGIYFYNIFVDGVKTSTDKFIVRH